MNLLGLVAGTAAAGTPAGVPRGLVDPAFWTSGDVHAALTGTGCSGDAGSVDGSVCSG